MCALCLSETELLWKYNNVMFSLYVYFVQCIGNMLDLYKHIQSNQTTSMYTSTRVLGITMCSALIESSKHMDI